MASKSLRVTKTWQIRHILGARQSPDAERVQLTHLGAKVDECCGPSSLTYLLTYHCFEGAVDL